MNEHYLLPSEPMRCDFLTSLCTCTQSLRAVSCATGVGYGQHYNKLASDRYYLKLDDDIMYIRPGSIDAMLHAKVTDRFYIVSANVINHSSEHSLTQPSALPASSWTRCLMHSDHLGVMLLTLT